MPDRPLRPCGAPGCPTLVPKGRCPTHTRAHERERGTTKERGYSGTHVHWAKAVLRRDPICRYCEREPSSDADHVMPWKVFGGKYDLDNGAGCCSTCHSIKTAKERRGDYSMKPHPRRELA